MGEGRGERSTVVFQVLCKCLYEGQASSRLVKKLKHPYLNPYLGDETGAISHGGGVLSESVVARTLSVRRAIKLPWFGYKGKRGMLTTVRRWRVDRERS